MRRIALITGIALAALVPATALAEPPADEQAPPERAPLAGQGAGQQGPGAPGMPPPPEGRPVDEAGDQAPPPPRRPRPCRRAVAPAAGRPATGQYAAAARRRACPAGVRVRYLVRGVVATEEDDGALTVTVKAANPAATAALDSDTSIEVAIGPRTRFVHKGLGPIGRDEVVAGDPVLVVWVAPRGLDAADLPAATRILDLAPIDEEATGGAPADGS